MIRSLICFATGVHAILLGSCLAACAPRRSEVALASDTLASTANPSPLTRSVAMQAVTTRSKMWPTSWTTACQACALKSKCTMAQERRIRRWEHEAVLEKVQQRLDRNPDKMTLRRQTAEHP